MLCLAFMFLTVSLFGSHGKPVVTIQPLSQMRDQEKEPRKPKDGYIPRKMTDEELKKVNEDVQRLGDKLSEGIFNRPVADPIATRTKEIAEGAKEQVLKHLIAKSTKCDLPRSSNDSLRSNQAHYTLIRVKGEDYLLEMVSLSSVIEAEVSDTTVDSKGVIDSAMVVVSVPNIYTIYGIPRYLLLGSPTLFTIEMKHPWTGSFVPKITWVGPARKILSNSQDLKPLSCGQVQKIISSSSKR